MNKQREAIALLRSTPGLAERVLSLVAPMPETAGSAQEAAAALSPLVMGYDTERLAVLGLNSRLQIVNREVLTVGSADYTVVCPKQVFRWALTQKRVVRFVVVAHNHPSGDPLPSESDYDVTRRLIRAGDLISIPVLDHIVVGDTSWVSMRAEGLLEFNTKQKPSYIA